MAIGQHYFGDNFKHRGIKQEWLAIWAFGHHTGQPRPQVVVVVIRGTRIGPLRYVGDNGANRSGQLASMVRPPYWPLQQELLGVV